MILDRIFSYSKYYNNGIDNMANGILAAIGSFVEYDHVPGIIYSTFKCSE